MLTAEARAKALGARKAAVKNNRFRTDWMDAPTWEKLAHERGMRLPQWHRPPTPKLLKKWHGKLDKEPFEGVYGCSPLRLIQLNSRMPLRAFIGQMLERA